MGGRCLCAVDEDNLHTGAQKSGKAGCEKLMPAWSSNIRHPEVSVYLVALLSPVLLHT